MPTVKKAFLIRDRRIEGVVRLDKVEGIFYVTIDFEDEIEVELATRSYDRASEVFEEVREHLCGV